MHARRARTGRIDSLFVWKRVTKIANLFSPVSLFLISFLSFIFLVFPRRHVTLYLKRFWSYHMIFISRWRSPCCNATVDVQDYRVIFIEFKYFFFASLICSGSRHRLLVFRGRITVGAARSEQQTPTTTGVYWLFWSAVVKRQQIESGRAWPDPQPSVSQETVLSVRRAQMMMWSVVIILKLLNLHNDVFKAENVSVGSLNWSFLPTAVHEVDGSNPRKYVLIKLLTGNITRLFTGELTNHFNYRLKNLDVVDLQ